MFVCDVAVSKLDVSIQSQILNLLLDLQARLGLACLFISLDLSVVPHISDEIGVMHRSRVVESGPTDARLHRRAIPIPGNCLPMYQGPRCAESLSAWDRTRHSVASRGSSTLPCESEAWPRAAPDLCSPALRAKTAVHGWVAEWSIAPVLKTGDAQASVGSNPTSSAI